MALDETEVSLRNESARSSLFHSQDPGKISVPPKERRFVPKRMSRFCGGRLDHIDKKAEDVSSDQEREIEKASLERDAAKLVSDERRQKWMGMSDPTLRFLLN